MRPGDERPELPTFEPPPREPGTILPPLDVPPLEPEDTRVLERGQRLLVRSVRVTGNTVLSEAEIADIVSPYVGRENDFADLQALRDRVTLAYIERGYVTSGATIPDQAVRGGELVIRVVEGTLAEVEVETSGRLRPEYVRSRLERGADGPVNVNDLDERLQMLQQDPHIQQVQAALVPTAELGKSRLNLEVYERKPYWLRLEGNNYRTPSIGSYGGSAELAYENITGFGDGIWARYEGSEGLNEVQARYEIPLTRYDTTLDLHFDRTWSVVVERPFDALDIESRTETYGFTLRQPVHRSLRSQVSLFLTGEWRRSKSFLLDRGFPFSEGVSDSGVAKISLLRSGFEWTSRTREQVFAARFMTTWGIDALGATNNGKDQPDGLFVAWLGQFQWARRLDELFDTQLLARFDFQLAESPLLGLEQFAVGGHSTVRGYPENTLVRDNGLLGSFEIRVPLWKRIEGLPIFEMGPFIDVGYSWNHPRDSNDTVGPSTLVGLGVAARVNLTNHVRLEASWADDLKEFDRQSPDYDLQDDGVYVGMTVSFP